MEFPILAKSTTPEGWRCTVAIPPEHPAFEGHFPGRPILPAIAHLALAAQAVAAMTGREAVISAVTMLRLRSPVAPGDALEVSIGRPVSDGGIPFEIRRGAERVSHGVLVVSRRG